MTPAFFDIETQSAADLKIVGSRIYAAHPTTRILTFAWCIDDEHCLWLPYIGSVRPVSFVPDTVYGVASVEVFCGSATPEPLLDAIHDSRRAWVAHNGRGFDELIWRRFLPEPAGGFIDTLPMARRAGLPGRLDEIGKRLIGTGKDSTGSAMLTRMYKKFDVAPRLAELVAVGRYNVADVAILRRLWDVCVDVEPECEVQSTDATINSRGALVDANLVRKLLSSCIEAKRFAAEEITSLTAGKLTGDDARSHQKLAKWLATQGVALPNMRAETIEAYLEEDDESIVAQVLRLRSGLTRITSHKLQRLLQSIDADGRLRDMFVYHGAHTGRWTGRKVQVQNLPRGVGSIDVHELSRNYSFEAARDAATKAKVVIDDVLGTLLRCVFMGPFAIADYAAIEGRGVAWCASEPKLLSIFADPRGDVYLDMAARIFGRPVTKADKAERQIGKVVVLGAGYGLSAVKLDQFCEAKRIDLSTANVTAKQCIDAFRSEYAAIPKLWRTLDGAAKAAVNGETVYAGRCWFAPWGQHLVIELPSGRQLVYRQARIEPRVPLWAKYSTQKVLAIPSVVYNGPRGESILYGGKIAENVVQAICRDLLAAALVRCEDAGLRPVIHVHDEIVTESQDVDELCRIMSDSPEWAAGFPVMVEGYTSDVYAKSAPPGARHAKYMNGVKV